MCFAALVALAASSARDCRGQEAPAPEAARESPPAADSAELTALVRQLGDDSFTARESAAKRLIAAGISSKPYLVLGSNDPDPEIRHRSERLLAEVEQLDMRNRLDAFIAGRDARAELPGWPTFRGLVGEGRAAREFFARMYQAEPELLTAYADHPQDVAATLSDRVKAATDFQGLQIGLIDENSIAAAVAALLLVASDREVALDATSASRLLSVVQQNPAIQGFQAVAGQRNPLLFALTNAWVARLEFANSANLYYRILMFAMQSNLPASVEVAKGLIRSNTAQASYRMYAVFCIGKQGGPDDISTLAGLLNDKSVCLPPANAPKPTQTSLELRDVALACLLHLTGQDLPSYGFDNPQANASYLYSPTSLYFYQPGQREEAISKWRRWAAANLPAANPPAGDSAAAAATR